MSVRFLLALTALFCLQAPALAQNEDSELLFPGFGDSGVFDDLGEIIDDLSDSLTGPAIATDRALIDNGYTLDLTAGGDASVGGCPGYFGEFRQLIIKYQPGTGLDELRIFAQSDADLTLRVAVNGQYDACDDDSYGGTNPLVVIPASSLSAGDELVVQVGTYEPGYADATLAVQAASTGAGAAIKKKEPLQSAPAGNTEFIDLAEGFTPDPLIVSGIMAGGGTTPSLEDCAYGFIPELPQASIVYDSQSGDSNLIIYVESDTDTTLHVVFEDQYYACDDDNHGNGNPIVVFPDADSGQYQVWVGTYSDGQTATATLHVSEKMPR